jgi:hypothetical protein
MTTAPTAEEKALAAQGADKTLLDSGQSRDGAPNAPADKGNKVPVKEGLDEVHGAADAAKVAADAAAKKKADDDAAAEAARVAAEKVEKPEITEYAAFDDPSASAAVELLKEANVSPKDANAIFAKAIETGDLRDIKEAKLVELVGKTKAHLIMTGVRDYYTRQSEANAVTVKVVHDAIGGEGNWTKIKDWAQGKEKNDPAFKQRLDTARDMLNKGGLYAESAAKSLKEAYDADPTTKGLGADTSSLLKGDNLSSATGAPFTRADYVTELKKAHDRGAKQAEIAALDARRMAGKKAGI